MTTEAVRAPTHRVDFAARFVVRAAMTAPSIENSQPWSFASSRDVISVYTDPERAASQTDPIGREMVMSGGAALFNLRLAMHHLGFAGDVRLLPRAGRLDHLADVRWGRYSSPTAYNELLYGAMTRRRTHHGRFTVAPVPAPLIAELGRLARDERAALHVISGPDQIRILAELVQMAEVTQRVYHDERAAPNGSGPADHRHNGHSPRWPASAPPRQPDGHALGVIAVLATHDDRPLDWLLAGQVLQRLLLHATTHGISAAFHTQPLELSDYRRQIQRQFTGGTFPQILLRLGHTGALR